MKSFKEYNANERRFRASIYVDVWVPTTDDIEVDREIATKKIKEMAAGIPNSYVGGIAAVHGAMLDKEI